MREVWFQTDPSAKSVITIPLESLESKNSAVKVIGLDTFKQVLGAKHSLYRGHKQNDAQEFLRHLIGDLHEEMETQERATG